MAEFRQTQTGTMVRVLLGYRDGKPIRRSKTFPKGTHKSTMQKWIRTQEENPTAKPSVAKPFDEVIFEYLKYKRYDLAPRTLTEYEGDCRRYLLGKLPNINEISQKDIQDLLDTYKHLSPKSQLRIKKYLSMVFNFATTKGYVEANPVDRSVKIAKQRRVKRINVLSVEQYESVLNSCDDLGLLTLFYTGLRISELLALESHHIRGNCIVVEQSLDCLVSTPRKVGRVKSKSSHRTIPIPKRLADLLSAELPSDGYVFPFGYDYYKARLEALCEALGTSRMTLHEIRHSHCTYLLAKGINALAVSRRLGHHSVSFTLSTYAHLIPDMNDKLIEALS